MVSIVLSPEDIPFEEQLQRTPYDFKLWWKYIQINIKSYNDSSVAEASPRAYSRLIHIFMLFERALKLLPGSYKLWKTYIEMRIKLIRHIPVTSPVYEQVNRVFERALAQKPLMPRLWLNYTKFLFRQGLISKTRNVFDSALMKLPVTQHDRIWSEYLKFAKQSKSRATALSVYKRYLTFTPEAREDFIDMLKETGNWEQVLKQLYEILQDKSYVSPRGTSKEGMWLSIGEICGKYGDKLKNSQDSDLDPVSILRQGIKTSLSNKGRMWCSLANYYSRLGNFEAAKSVYEEACKTVTSAKDFSIIFDSHIKLEETIISAELDFCDDDEEQEGLEDDEESIDALMDRLDDLLGRREKLLNRVLIRRNPQDVGAWENCVELCLREQEDPKRFEKAYDVYEEAMKALNPADAINGRICDLYVNYSKLCEKNNDFQKADEILRQGRCVNYRLPDELATVWCAHVECLLRANQFDQALALIEDAITPINAKVDNANDNDPNKIQEKNYHCRKQVYQNQRVWNLYLDLQENFSTLDGVRATYEQAISLRVASPQTILNYALYLEENKYFEESFRAFEKGISLFSFPHVLPVWKAYLSKFIQRYEGNKLERARDLFEECCETIPPKYAKELFLKYADFEVKHGLARRAMSVYERAAEYVVEEEQYDVYCRYIKQAEEIFGAPHTRAIYQKAIEVLPNKYIPEISISFAKMEVSLNEVDRARAILSHGSQVCDPRVIKSFWQHWKDFEVQHGNEDTFKEMLRVQRSVKASYLSSHYIENLDEAVADGEVANIGLSGNSSNKNGIGIELNPELNASISNENSDVVSQPPGVEMGTGTVGLSFVPQAQTISVDDDAEIDIDDDEDEDDADITQQSGALAMFQKAREKTDPL